MQGEPTQDVADALTARLAQQNALKASPPGASTSAAIRAAARLAAAQAGANAGDKMGWGVGVSPTRN